MSALAWEPGEAKKEPIATGAKVKVLIAGSNKWLWPYAYRDEGEAERMIEWLDKKFELNAPFYILEVTIA